MTLQKCNLFDFVKVLTSSYDISVFDYLFLTFFIILITEFWKFSIKFINGIIIDTHSIYLQIYWTIIKGADLNKYTFSLLNIEWKVYLFKLAHFSCHQIPDKSWTIFIKRINQYSENFWKLIHLVFGIRSIFTIRCDSGPRLCWSKLGTRALNLFLCSTKLTGLWLRWSWTQRQHTWD